ncbi:hypothetical protein Pmar_PMAR010007 [Perkinsus marinus ATCC 50983]|uniref:Uncharacterized protein n=1 Tax=Perkinsus marinus (strain ATCC 50983 / TXsc) TaxID=423536 RepID=C5KA62_PERM5|nr:hypothetical protein Pmar_PMAR010007 [Perkinsus marinus ATCC 50983]EER18631.1 hypothetical protein Pmar_PMAR010007 [Perkinsus marinus ATCC 50983]|eukprot:XP_002786835.1 hypothetical protein Pmar_PMAR010007 [Perkinsus marinus ATCC 50983]
MDSVRRLGDELLAEGRLKPLYTVYLHRAYAAFLMGAVLSNKVLVERMLRPGKDSVQFRWVPGVMWAVNMGFLVSVRYFDGFRFSAIAPWLAFLDG